MALFKWDRTTVLYAIEFTAVKQVSTTSRSVKARKRLELAISRLPPQALLPRLLEHMVDPMAAPFPDKFTIYQSSENLSFLFDMRPRSKTVPFVQIVKGVKTPVWKHRVVVTAM
ncbi:hypothetical protein IAT38_000239 [Cryptococcus sp. DSM 104549]